MHKNTIIVTLLYIINEACFAATPNLLSDQNQTSAALEINSICSNTQTLAKSLHTQRLNLENGYKEDFLNSMGINAHPNSHLNLVSARRISGECAGHLDDIHSTTFHFDTDITLTLNDEGIFVPNTKNYLPQFIIRNDDIHPGMIPYIFEKAIEVG